MIFPGAVFTGRVTPSLFETNPVVEAFASDHRSIVQEND